MTELAANGANARAVIVHDLEHLRAVEAARAQSQDAFVLYTPPDATNYLGVGYLTALRDATELAMVIDCGDNAGDATAALHAGWTEIIFSGPEAMHQKISDIAAQTGAKLVPRPKTPIDLAADPKQSLRQNIT